MARLTGIATTICAMLLAVSLGAQSTQVISDSNGGQLQMKFDASGNLMTTGSGGGTSTVAIDQTTQGTTNGVVLKAGTALAGKVGIDQTTPGTTNGVVVNSGANIMGKVTTDQTTHGTTDKVAGDLYVNGALATAANPAPVQQSLGGVAISASNPLPTNHVLPTLDYYPSYNAAPSYTGNFSLDPSGSLITRGSITTDEGGYRTAFSGSSLGLGLGSCVFTNGSTTVTGTGFGSGGVLHYLDFVKLDADAESAWAQISTFTDTTITLRSAYIGTGGTGASSAAILAPTTGTGGTIAVASGQATIASGTTTATTSAINRLVDYSPLVKQVSAALSQRIVNQTSYVGFVDPSATPKYWAWFKLDGTTNTTVITETAHARSGTPSGNLIETNTVTIPNGLTSATALRYRVEVSDNTVRFFINDVLVARHYKAVPRPFDSLVSTCRIVNGTSPAGSTTMTLDYDSSANFNTIKTDYASQTSNVRTSPLDDIPFAVAGLTGTGDLVSVDCNNYAGLKFQWTAGAGTITFYTSDDASNWVSTMAYPVAGGASATTATAYGAWWVPTSGRYAKISVTAYTSGTFAGTCYASNATSAIALNTINATVSGSTAVGTAPGSNPAPLAVDVAGLTRRLLLNVFGEAIGPGEYISSFTVGTGAAAVTDGTNGKTFVIPSRESDVYVGISAISTTPTMQLEGSFDNILWTIIPMGRYETTAASLQYTALTAFTPAIGQVYHGKTYGYPLLRVHLTAGSASNTTGFVRVVPDKEAPEQTVTPFSLTAANTTEAVGVANGQVATGGIRTLAVPCKGSAKAVLYMDAMTYSGTTSAGIQMVLEGNTNPGAAAADTTWQTLSMQPLAGGPTITTYTGPVAAYSVPAAGKWEADVSNMALVRVRMSNAGTGETVPVIHGGLKIIPIASNQGLGTVRKACYSLSVNALSPTSATNVAVIEASATKEAIIKRLIISPGVATANGWATLTLNRNTVAATAAGSTPTAATLNRDTYDAAFGGMVRYGAFTVVGVTTVASNVVIPIPTPISTTTTPAAPIIVDLTAGGTQKGFVVPHGVLNGCMLTHSGLTGGASFGIIIEWTEE